MENYPFNPFEVDVRESINKLTIPLLFIYSKTDNIVDSKHSQKIIEKCNKRPFCLEINEEHNIPRSRETITKIQNFINDLLKKTIHHLTTPKRRRGISLSERDHNEDQ